MHAASELLGAFVHAITQFAHRTTTTRRQHGCAAVQLSRALHLALGILVLVGEKDRSPGHGRAPFYQAHVAQTAARLAALTLPQSCLGGNCLPFNIYKRLSSCLSCSPSCPLIPAVTGLCAKDIYSALTTRNNHFCHFRA